MSEHPKTSKFEWSDEHGDLFIGHEHGCGDEQHRTTGARAWCFQCSTWCYSFDGCPGCVVGVMEASGAPVACAYCRALVTPEDREIHEERCRDLGALLLRFTEGV